MTDNVYRTQGNEPIGKVDLYSKRIDNAQSAIHWLRKKQPSNEWAINYWESVVNSLTRAMTRTNA